MILSKDEYLSLLDRINSAESAANCASRELADLQRKYEALEKSHNRRLNVVESKLTSIMTWEDHHEE